MHLVSFFIYFLSHQKLFFIKSWIKFLNNFSNKFISMNLKYNRSIENLEKNRRWRLNRTLYKLLMWGKPAVHEACFFYLFLEWMSGLQFGGMSGSKWRHCRLSFWLACLILTIGHVLFPGLVLGCFWMGASREKIIKTSLVCSGLKIHKTNRLIIISLIIIFYFNHVWI